MLCVCFFESFSSVRVHSTSISVATAPITVRTRAQELNTQINIVQWTKQVTPVCQDFFFTRAYLDFDGNLQDKPF